MYKRQILVVSEQKRLIKASEILSLTPPAVTIQLRQAEEEIGLLLFDRTSDGLKLTDAGTEVAKWAQYFFGQLNDLSNKLDEVIFAKRGSVKFGIVSTAKYFGHNIGRSIKEKNCDQIIREIISLSKKKECRIFYPTDVLVSQDLNGPSENKELDQVSYNKYDRTEFRIDEKATNQFYEAIKKFDELANSDKFQWRHILKPGELLIFNNWRILHGRGSFTGKRKMAGCYINMEDFKSACKIHGIQ